MEKYQRRSDPVAVRKWTGWHSVCLLRGFDLLDQGLNRRLVGHRHLIDDLLLRVLHALLQPAEDAADHGSAVEAGDEADVLLAQVMPADLLPHILLDEILRDIIEIPEDHVPVFRVVQMIDCVLILQHEMILLKILIIQAVKRLLLGKRLVRLEFQKLLHHLIDITEIVVKRISCQLALITDVPHRNLIDRFYLQELQRTVHDRLPGEFRHSATPLSHRIRACPCPVTGIHLAFIIQ